VQIAFLLCGWKAEVDLVELGRIEAVSKQKLFELGPKFRLLGQ
jgi:hypothetical protein